MKNPINNMNNKSSDVKSNSSNEEVKKICFSQLMPNWKIIVYEAKHYIWRNIIVNCSWGYVKLTSFDGKEHIDFQVYGNIWNHSKIIDKRSKLYDIAYKNRCENGKMNYFSIYE
jgi:hypothetical protein